MFRVYSTSRPTCEICGNEINVNIKNNQDGVKWLDGIELIDAWLDHQLDYCSTALAKEVTNNEGAAGG